MLSSVDQQLMNLKFCEGRNSLKALESWVDESLSNLSSEEDVKFLTKVAQEVIDSGGFRGNIEDAWEAHGWTYDNSTQKLLELEKV